MPVCEHECLHLIRIDLPDAPFPMFFGVVYLVPVGSPFFDENSLLLTELENRVAEYRMIGSVCIM